MLNSLLPYLIVIGIILASGFGLPIPEDIPLLLGGYYCGIGDAELMIMLPLAIAAVFGSDLIVFAMGRRYGHHIPKLPLIRTYLSEARLAKADLYFHSHGGKTLFMARFMPGLRTAVFFSAGACKTPVWKMFAFDGTAALLSVPVWVLLAWGFADQIDRVREWSKGTHLTIVAILCVVALFVIFGRRVRGRRLASAG